MFLVVCLCAFCLLAQTMKYAYIALAGAVLAGAYIPLITHPHTHAKHRTYKASCPMSSLHSPMHTDKIMTDTTKRHTLSSTAHRRLCHFCSFACLHAAFSTLCCKTFSSITILRLIHERLFTPCFLSSGDAAAFAPACPGAPSLRAPGVCSMKVRWVGRLRSLHLRLSFR